MVDAKKKRRLDYNMIMLHQWFTMLHQQVGAVFHCFPVNSQPSNFRNLGPFLWQPRFIEAIINGTT